MIYPFLLPLIWLILIILEAWYNWYVIECLHHRINHRWHTAYRVPIGFALWFFSPILSHEMDQAQWWAFMALVPLTFWAVFDTLLNWMRGRYLCYLGNGDLDRLQKKYGGETLWFSIKWILAIAISVRYFTL